MARPPFFIRELKRPPNEDGGFIFTPKKQSLRQIINNGFQAERELFAQNQTRINEKNRNENRILNLSNNLDSIRTYSWQAIFEFSSDQERLAGDIPIFTLAIKNIEFPSYIQDKTNLSIDGKTLGILYGLSSEKTFRLTVQDLYRGNGSILGYLFNKQYIPNSDAVAGGSFNLRILKYTTDGELFEILAFSGCTIFGYKLGNYDYHKNEMQEYLLEISYDSFMQAPSNYADKTVSEIINIGVESIRPVPSSSRSNTVETSTEGQQNSNTPFTPTSSK